VIAGDHQAVMRQVLDWRKRPTPRTHGAVVSSPVESVLTQALAVNPKDRTHDVATFWRALLDAKGRGADALEVASAIPDLVPIARKPSGSHQLDLPSRKPSGAHQLDLPSHQSIDFDAGEGGEGLSLSLDVAPGELVRQGSLAALHAPPSGAGVASGPAPSGPTPSPGRRPTPALGLPAARPAAGPAVALAAPQTMADAFRSSRPPPPPVSSPPPRGKAPAPLVRRLVPGLAVAGSSIVLTLLDRIYVAVTGEVFTLGPLKTSMVAAVLLVGGLALGGREVLRK
jgi:hypothetical protein